MKTFEICVDTSWRCVNKNSLTWWYILKTSWRCLKDTFPRTLEDGLKTSSRHLEDVLKTFWRRLEDIWPRRIYSSWSRHLEDVLKMSSEDLWLRWIYLSWSRCLEDVLKTFFEDEDKKNISSRRIFVGKFFLGMNLIFKLRQCFKIFTRFLPYWRAS